MDNQISFIDNLKDKINTSIERLKCFENQALNYSSDGYYLAYSGGKDSDVILKLAELANIRFKAYYNLTSVDPPELVQKIKADSRITIVKPQFTMWDLIVKKKYPPSRLSRYCCQFLKEHGGDGKFCITGVRWYESYKRKNNRSVIEVNAYRKYINRVNDNTEGRQLLENCKMRSKHILNPIIDWTDSDVWEFIKSYKINYCKLYNCGYKRLGCIGCPLGGSKNQLRDFGRYPKYKKAYIRAFDRMIEARINSGLKTSWKSGEDVFNWWVKDKRKNKNEILENQINLFDNGKF